MHRQCALRNWGASYAQTLPGWQADTRNKRMRTILIIRHWQIFIIWLAYMCLWMTILNMLGAQTADVFDQIVFVLVPLTSYPLFLAWGLRTYFNVGTHTSIDEVRQFFFFGLVWAISYASYYIVSDEQMIGRSVIGIVSLYAFFQFAKHPARMIKFIELRREPGFWEYTADVFQILMWPLFIWAIQPRINKIFEKQVKRNQPIG
jgi:hypothetical protein